MKKLVVNHWLKIIKKHKNYNEEKLEEIEYGLTGFYMTIEKAIVIIILASILGILKETIIFLFLFNLIRLCSFGIHAKKSWMCLITSIIFFIGIPLISINININIYFKLILGIINIILIYIYSPADTKKRPIVNKKRRKIYKIISSITAIVFVILSILIKDNYLSNSFIFALILQNILISPITYKVCREPYNNYIAFLKEHPDYA